MNNDDEARLRDLVKDSFRSPAHAELEHDLWPRMLRRLDQGHVRPSWVDGVLAAAAGVWILVFPEVIPGLLYHL
jgi:hypothetical protein